MCKICVDFQKGTITAREAARNFHEMASTLDQDHADKLADEIQVALLEEELENE